MGDIIEFTTWPEHQNLFYILKTNAVNFEVKASGNALVRLGGKPNSYDISIGIGDYQNSCWILKDDNNRSSATVHNAITSTQYKKFWITWAGGCVRLGRDGQTIPLVTLTCELPDINYVTFGVLRHYNPVQWRLELPPEIITSKCKPISGGNLTWIHAEDQLPKGALIGGFQNETVYIARGEHRDSLTPGKFVPSEGTAYIPWGGDEHSKSMFEVLCGYNCIWVQSCEDKIPVGAFPGGYSEAHREILYIGRAEHNGYLIPGKIHPSHKVCYIPFDGREIAKKTYEILIDPNITVGPMIHA